MASVFEVDRIGLRKLLERKGKHFALYELLQNSWDQNVLAVKMVLTKAPGARVAKLSVEDDDPDGFADLAHSYTLFAESAKKANPRQRGRFNIGEKLVIAICEESRIITTKGGVEFVGNERRTLRRTTERGSIFEGVLRLTNSEFMECCEAVKRLIPPTGIETYFNGELLERREPIAVIEHLSLRTEIADDEGYLKPTTRQTEIRIYKPLRDEVGTLYELGIPVVETGDDYHCDIQQKVPLNSDRDNVQPAFLRTIRTAVLNQVHQRLTEESANHVWVKSAMQDPDISADAVRSVVTRRFGEDVVSFDPNDHEANHRAVAAGYTVVHGSSLSKAEWANIRRARESGQPIMPPAGSVFPTDPGIPTEYPELTPSAQELRLIEAIIRIARVLIDRHILVKLYSGRDSAAARYGSGVLYLNKFRLGKSWFVELREEVVDLLIHELGHEYSDNHLSEAYYRALTTLGARLAFAVAKNPSLLVA